jgi:hypothetical protein
MPAFALLFSLIWSATLGAVGGMVAALAVWMTLSANSGWHQRRRKAAMWAFVMAAAFSSGYALWSRWGPRSVPTAELYEAVPGLRDREAEIVKSQDWAGMDAATTHVWLRGPRQAAQRIAARYKLASEPSDDSSLRRWGNGAPQWWPDAPCNGGYAYEQGSSTNRSPDAGRFAIDNALDADISLYDCPTTDSIFVVIQRRW